MWPYNDDEAGWLQPERKRPEQLLRTPANDNDPARRLSLRALPAPARKPDPDA